MATAESILASVRDLVPDPTYATDGTTQPMVDGQFLRQQTLIRWLNQAQAIVSEITKCVEDWTAFPGILNQDSYAIDPRFFEVSAAWYDGFAMTPAPQTGYFFRGLVTGPALTYTLDGTAPRLRLGVWPFAGRSPGSSFLSQTLNPTDTTIPVVSVANFGSSGGPGVGWLLLNHAELVTYRTVNSVTNQFGVVTRGRGGTPIVTHPSGAVVQEANIWVKGFRLATPVALAVNSAPPLKDPGWLPGSYTLGVTDPLDIPDNYTSMLEDYILSRVKHKEQDAQYAGSLEKGFRQAVQDSAQRTPRRLRSGYQVREWGAGGLWSGRWIVP